MHVLHDIHSFSTRIDSVNDLHKNIGGNNLELVLDRQYESIYLEVYTLVVPLEGTGVLWVPVA